MTILPLRIWKRLKRARCSYWGCTVSEPRPVIFKPRWPVTLDPAAEASLAEPPFTGGLPTEPPRIDTRIIPRDGWYKLSLRSLSEITDLTQKLADYSGYDVIYGPNPDFSDLRSLSSEVSLFTSLTSEPFAEGSFVIPACLESDPYTLLEPGEKRQIDTDAVAERFGEILSSVDKDKAPTSVSIGALQTNDSGLESAKPDLQSTFKKPGGDTAVG